MNQTMQETKTGALVCKKSIAGSQNKEYEALLYITNIPADVTDEQLSAMLDSRNMKNAEANECEEILVRADINATANEVWEQYNGLSGDAGKAHSISFLAITHPSL